MRDLTPLEQELVDYLVAFWADPTNALPLEFYQRLATLGRLRRDKASVHRLLTDEVTILRSSRHPIGLGMSYREQYRTEQDYRESLRLRVVSRSTMQSHPTVTGHASTPPGIYPDVRPQRLSPDSFAHGYQQMSVDELVDCARYLKRHPQEIGTLRAEMAEIGMRLANTRTRAELLAMTSRRMDIARLVGFPTDSQDHQCSRCDKRIFVNINAKCHNCGSPICECGWCTSSCSENSVAYSPWYGNWTDKLSEVDIGDWSEIERQLWIEENGPPDDDENWTDYWHQFRQSRSDEDDPADIRYEDDDDDY